MIFCAFNCCLLCQTSAIPGLLCAACQDELPHNLCCCPQCAQPLPQPDLCPNCQQAPPAFTATVAPFLYQPPLANLLARWKHRADQRLLPLLASQLTLAVQQHYQHQDWPHLLVPVPLHPLRLIRRGFHQTAQLAHRLGRQLSLPVDAAALARSGRGHSQQGLNKSQRARNLKGKFTPHRRFQGEHLALVDDVMTTGATARLLAELLIEQGAGRVDVWVLARTP